jgi:hypothetical protein
VYKFGEHIEENFLNFKQKGSEPVSPESPVKTGKNDSEIVDVYSQKIIEMELNQPNVYSKNAQNLGIGAV